MSLIKTGVSRVPVQRIAEQDVAQELTKFASQSHLDQERLEQVKRDRRQTEDEQEDVLLGRN